uniref:phenylalanyl-tRNA synthetase beta subunit n=1 Tax=Goniotrichopsis reniformis TaxID=468933 RepID=UPI001FCE09C2|nr:phenylalanyl-tRNA synthetase beta subunit [Goniotrichopsis reniformis]UNJ14730.1 phenylalanyl-tRNA synthetase beta subunit [Goniotrichopsis reniformis]
MKISLSWLNKVLNMDQIDLEDLAERLTLAGFEVDDMYKINSIDNLPDTILDITPPPNRGDTLSVLGLSREIAALYNIKYNLVLNKQEPIKKNESLIQFKQIDHCLYYSITLINNIIIKNSPNWLQNNLHAIGINPKNNLLDILNYVLYEYGQPIQAFEFNNEHLPMTIDVRKPTSNLDFIDRNLDKIAITRQNLVSWINERPVNISGVTCSEDSIPKTATNSIVLETAIFDPSIICQSATAISMKNDISLRFERGINPNLLHAAYNHTITLIQDLCEGSIAANTFIDKLNSNIKFISLYKLNVEMILGDTIQKLMRLNLIEQILNKLDFKFTKKEYGWLVEVPIHRHNDIEREIDIIEEIGRIYGFNNFPYILPHKQESSLVSMRNQIIKHCKYFFICKGFYELTHYSFQKNISVFKTHHGLEINNPLTIDQKFLRRSILPELLNSLVYNIAQGNGSFNSFEIGRVFSSHNNNFIEEDFIAGIIGGHLIRSSWEEKPRVINWFEAKGILDNFIQFLNLDINWQQSDHSEYFNKDIFHKFRWGIITSGELEIGIFGQIHPQLMEEYDINSTIYLFEMNLETILRLCNKKQYHQHLNQTYSIYPSISRDINMLVPINIPIKEIMDCIHNMNNELLQSIELFDDYHDTVLKEHRQLSFRLFYRSLDRTLNIEEADILIKKLKIYLSKQLNITVKI